MDIAVKSISRFCLMVSALAALILVTALIVYIHDSVIFRGDNTLSKKLWYKLDQKGIVVACRDGVLSFGTLACTHCGERGHGPAMECGVSCECGMRTGTGFAKPVIKKKVGVTGFGFIEGWHGHRRARAISVPLWFLVSLAAYLIWWILFGRAGLLHRHRMAKGHCPSCDYNLTGNISGVCPECGTEIRVKRVV